MLFKTLLSLSIISITVTATFAGSLDSPAAPSDPASAMFTIDDIYNRFDTGAAGSKRTGGFVGPTAGPGSSRHTTDEIMNKAPSLDNTNGASPSDVLFGKTFWCLVTGNWGIKRGLLGAPLNPKTGQTTSYDTRDDGSMQKGVTWASPRFTDNGNGTITDNNTGLIWLKNAGCFSSMTQSWTTALSSCNSLANDSCGLTDGSIAGDWRLPSVKELRSLIDYGRYSPALPSGHPFIGVVSVNYWSSSTVASNTANAWYVYLNNGEVSNSGKTSALYVWPVKGGE
ncbi:MAG: DUF1566 domain-containing protein [Desulfobacterales bacterium]|nr:DUF1566 domain-containing protein [Desulfobacterales bacterium]